MRIYYFVCFFFLGNAQVLQVMEVISKLYELIDIISSTTKFFANNEPECDSHHFLYEVRETYVCVKEA